MFILSCISGGLDLCSKNHNLIYEDSEIKNFKIMKFLGEICNDWPKDLLGTNVYKTREYC